MLPTDYWQLTLTTSHEFVERGQAVLDVETDKATMEVEALNSGMLLQQIVHAGQKVGAGDLLALIGIGEPREQSSDPAPEDCRPAESRTYPRDFLLSLYRGWS
jgi:pyruvate/2-oxoglutarate dehydrogenase complex dihydrolipoamide acyltransferase (E2) component